MCNRPAAVEAAAVATAAAAAITMCKSIGVQCILILITLQLE